MSDIKEGMIKGEFVAPVGTAQNQIHFYVV